MLYMFTQVKLATIILTKLVLFGLFLIQFHILAYSQTSDAKCAILKTEIFNSISRSFETKFSKDDCSIQIGTDFFAKLQFDGSGRLIRVKVSPRNDRESYMSQNDLNEFISKLELAQPIGEQLEKGNLGIITNMRSPVIDRYQYAFIYSSQNPEPNDRSGNQVRILDFSVEYIRPIFGTITAKRSFQNVFRDGNKLFQVKVGQEWFSVSKDQYQDVRIGIKCSIDAAGSNRSGQ